MRLLVCAYEDVDAERVLVVELSDLDEAVACCRDLVESEGYPRGEVWSAAGRRLFVVERDGSAIYEGELPSEAALFESPAMAHEPHVPRGHRASARPSLSGQGDAPSTGQDAPAEPGPLLPPPPSGPVKPADLLGEQPDSGERWFGL
jgi:hypothetical protein